MRFLGLALHELVQEVKANSLQLLWIWILFFIDCVDHRLDAYLMEAGYSAWLLGNQRSTSEEAAIEILVNEDLLKSPRTDVNVEDDYDGWFSSIISFMRIVSFFTVGMVTTLLWALIMVMLLPWPSQRIKQGNIYGHVTGRMIMWILGNPIRIEGAENSSERAIYISNHASLIDPLLLMYLTPIGTLFIAAKEIIWYPLFGQVYFLANHLRIDRSSPTSAIKSMKEGANEVVKNNLSMIIFPEGTRSEDGRLLPFKKGFIHLALQTQLPIVPIVVTGTHRAWRKGSLRVRPVPITVKYLDPITTSDWIPQKIDEYISFVHNLYVNNLPESQKPGVLL